MPALVSLSNSNSWPPPRIFQMSPAQQIGWTCQMESLEGRDQLSVLQLGSQGVRPSNQGRTEDECSIELKMMKKVLHPSRRQGGTNGK